MHALIDLYITPLQGPHSVLTCAFILKCWLFGLFPASAYTHDQLLVRNNALKFSSAFHFNFKSLAIF